MKTLKLRLMKSAAPALAAGLVFLSACSGPGSISTEDVRGLLQAMEGKEMVITLDDGSTVRITVSDAGSASSVKQMVGREVRATVSVRDDERSLNRVERIGEDDHFTGVIESMGSETWSIGGKTFRVNANTGLDGGLAVGATARVEFITDSDGTLLATEIETDAEDEQFKGNVDSVGAATWVIGGQTFKIDPATRIEDGLAAGSPVRVHFVVQPDGSLLALRIRSDREDEHFSGVIQSMTGGNWTIGGKLFIVNAATMLDDGLTVGVKARVEFITLTDGSMVATEIETDEADERFSGTVNQTGASAWIVDGRTFKVSPATRIDSGLGVGSRVRVRFTSLSDGSMLATRIQADNTGPGNQRQDFTGTVESVGTDRWVVGGRTFSVNPATRIDPGLSAGSRVRVRFNALADGSFLATRIKLDEMDEDDGIVQQEAERQEGQPRDRFTGSLDSIAPGKVVVSGRTFVTDNSTAFDKDLAVGGKSTVEFRSQPDGSSLAVEIKMED